MAQESEKTEHAVTTVRENTENQDSRRGDLVRTIISVIVIIIAGALLGWYYRQRNTDTEVAQTPPPPVDIQVPVDATPPPQDNGTGIVFPPPPNAQTPPPPAAEPTPAATPPSPRVSSAQTTAPEFRPLSHPSLGFQYIIKGDWYEQATENGFAIFDAAGNLLGTIEVFNAGAESLSSIRQQLLQSPTVSNIQTITKNGYQMLHYNIAGSSGFGYALVEKGKVYYIEDASGSLLINQFRIL